LLFGCDASVSAGIGRLEDIERPPAGRLVLRRTDGRADFIVAVRGRETRDFGLAVEDFGLAAVALAVVVRLAVVRFAVVRLAAVPDLAVLADREVERTVVRFAAVRGLLTLGLAEADFGFAVEAFGFAVVLRATDALRAVEDRRAVDALRAVEARLTVVAATGLTDCMVLAAAIRALAAVAMALVAVFIDRMADDIVMAEVLALVAAAVILLAAVVTLVAAEDTFLAAVAGVAMLLVEAVRRGERAAVLRVERDVMVRVERAAVLRDRDAVLRLAGLRVVDEAVVPAFLAAMLRVLLGFALARDFGRLAVPDALRLTDLLRAVLAELRRLAARVVVLTGTEFSPRLDQLRWCYSTCGLDLHTQRLFAEDEASQDGANQSADSLRRVTTVAAGGRASNRALTALWQSPCAFRP
jgi:hypothetical protein